MIEPWNWLYQNIGLMASTIAIISTIVGMIRHYVVKFDADMKLIHAKSDATNQRIDETNQRIDAMGHRIDAMGQRIDHMYTIMMIHLTGINPNKKE